MNAPTRWSEQRFGLVVQNSVAAVPAWAPIGYDAHRYRQYLGEDGSDGLVEVVAHHRDRWGHVDRFDDFADLLTFEHFDAAEWARLAVEAGMTYLEVQSRDPDGWCWWDAPDTDRTTGTGCGCATGSDGSTTRPSSGTPAPGPVTTERSVAGSGARSGYAPALREAAPRRSGNPRQMRVFSVHP